MFVLYGPAEAVAELSRNVIVVEVGRAFRRFFVDEASFNVIDETVGLELFGQNIAVERGGIFLGVSWTNDRCEPRERIEFVSC